MNFLKNLFTKKPREIKLKSIEIQDYLDENSPKILAEEYEIIKKDINDLKTNLEKLKEKLTNLENIELINLSEREKLFFEGNKKAYLTKTYKFLEHIFTNLKLIDEDNLNFKKLEEFCNEFNISIDNLNKDVEKNYAIISHYIDLKDSNEFLKKISQIINEINDFLMEGKLSEYKKLIHYIKQYNEKLLLTEKIEKEIKEIEKLIQENKEKKVISQKKLEEIKESSEYLAYKKLLSEKESIIMQIKTLNSQLNNNFKTIDKELKKYAHESLKNEIIFEYLSNPLEALEKDTELKILHTLEQIKMNLELELEKNKDNQENEKNLKKTLKNFSNLTKENLEKIKKDLVEIKRNLDIVQGVLDRSTIVMEIKDLEYQIEHFTKKIIELETEIKNKKEKLKDLEKISKEKLEKMLYDFTEQKIIILE
ncbi:MAG: hypothetical protein QXE31_01765 [Candidatus Woesearchaeota archaeon]